MSIRIGDIRASKIKLGDRIIISYMDAPAIADVTNITPITKNGKPTIEIKTDYGYTEHFPTDSLEIALNMDNMLEKGNEMSDNRTPFEIYADWVRTINTTHNKGWVHVNHATNRWLFKSPSGTVHDLLGCDLDKLDYIEATGFAQVLN
jgi:hypothetical protein